MNLFWSGHWEQLRHGTDYHQTAILVNNVFHGKWSNDSLVKLATFGFQIEIRLSELRVKGEQTVDFFQCRNEPRSAAAPHCFLPQHFQALQYLT